MLNGSGVQKLAFAATLLSLLTVHSTLLVSAAQSYFEFCNPYWSDCVSISKTGRYGLAYWMFKLGILPVCGLLAAFWLGMARCINPSGQVQSWIVALGFVSATALAVYTLALGHSGEAFRLLRRTGVVLFFALSFINQVLVADRMRLIAECKVLATRSLILSGLVLTIAIASLILDAILGPDYDRIENAFEWWLWLLLLVNLSLLACCARFISEPKH